MLYLVKGAQFQLVLRAAIFLCVLGLSFYVQLGDVQGQAHPSPEVASVAPSPADQAVVEGLESLGVAVTRRALPAGSSDVDFLLWARNQPEALVLWVDSRTSTITVLRTADGTSLSRVLGQETFAASPYVVALATTELLDLIRDTPVTKVETSPVLPLPVLPVSPDASSARSYTWGGSLGGELSAGVSGGPAMLRPAVGLDASFMLRSATFLYGELRAMPLGSSAETVRSETGRALIRYQRSDLGLRLGAGLIRGPASVVGYLAPGVGLLRVQAEDLDGDRARTRRRTQYLVGLGGLFRYWMGDHVGLVFAVDVSWLTSPARYLVDGKLALKEDPLRIGASLAVLGRF